MIRYRAVRVCAGLVLTGCASLLHADLGQGEFVEAVALLGLDPETLAAAGVAESDLIAAFEQVSESDAQWASVVAHRNTLRDALDAIVDHEDGDGMQAVNSARASLTLSLTGWRDSITAAMPQAVRTSVSLMASQSSSGLPAYLLMKEWTAEELAMLSKGIADHRRQQRTGDLGESAALNFYLDALSDGEVITAKASWDARKAIYSQRFTERLAQLD